MKLLSRNIAEIMTGLFMKGKKFIPEDWQLNPVTMYFEHKTKRFTHESMGEKQEVPYIISARSVHRLLSVKS